jgi:predicted DCC family thiol-disulfide oxidoreductase YuxK
MVREAKHPAVEGSLQIKMLPTTMGSSFQSNPIILYDGVCGLCNRLVQFVLKRDPHDRFRFASLQSVFAANILVEYAANPKDLDTMYALLNYQQPGESLAARSDAAIAVLLELGDFWRGVGVAVGILPKWFRDWGYRLIATNRYRIFGKYDQCPLPEERYRHKFLDM